LNGQDLKNWDNNARPLFVTNKPGAVKSANECSKDVPNAKSLVSPEMLVKLLCARETLNKKESTTVKERPVFATTRNLVPKTAVTTNSDASTPSRRPKNVLNLASKIWTVLLGEPKKLSLTNATNLFVTSKLDLAKLFKDQALTSAEPSTFANLAKTAQLANTDRPAVSKTEFENAANMNVAMT
jgi:hypothetical protein